MRELGRLIAMSGALLFIGCSAAAPPLPDRFPLTGEVIYQGRPITGGGLIFVPAEGGSWNGVTVHANINSDGTFVATSERIVRNRPEDELGAPLGRYKAIYHPLSDGSKAGTQWEFADIIEVTTSGIRVTLTLPTTQLEGGGAVRDDANPPDRQIDR
jgi:hypothetical protein